MSLHLSTSTRSAERMFKDRTSEVQNSSPASLLVVAPFAITGSQMPSTLKQKKRLAVEEKVA